jgi:hypothetical protein
VVLIGWHEDVETQQQKMEKYNERRWNYKCIRRNRNRVPDYKSAAFSAAKLRDKQNIARLVVV